MSSDALIPVQNLQHNCHARSGTKTHAKRAERLSAPVSMLPCGHSGLAPWPANNRNESEGRGHGLHLCVGRPLTR
jgi:hypothetical protein